MVLSDFCEKIKISRCRWPGYYSIAHSKLAMLLVISTPGGHYVLGSVLEIITLWPHATFVVCFLLCLFINHTVLFYARSQQLHQGSSCDDDTKFIC